MAYCNHSSARPFNGYVLEEYRIIVPLPAPYEQPHNSAFLERTILHFSVVREEVSSTPGLWRALQVLLIPWARESRSRRHSLSRHLSTRRDQVPDVKESFDIGREDDASMSNVFPSSDVLPGFLRILYSILRDVLSGTG